MTQTIKEMKKNFLVKALFITVVALLSAACYKSHDNGHKVAVLLPDDSIIDRWAIDKQNLEDVMDQYGFDATFYVAPENEDGAVQQIQQIKTAIKSGAKYLVITPIDYNAINESKVLEQYPSVKVVCHDRFIQNNPCIDFFSSTDTKEIGRMQAMFLLNHYHSSGAATMTIEILAGPDTDNNAKDYYDGAMDLLRKYIVGGQLIVKSGKKEYNDVKADSWNVADGKEAMEDRLASYAEGECPDMILASSDNMAQGAIEALMEAGITDVPVITGQDNSEMTQIYIKAKKQTMTIDKNLRDMAYNTGLLVNGLISKSPVQTSQSVGGVPVLYSKITLVTIDSF